MGKTGPLYEFDAAGEIRLRQDAAVDCGESHPAKVLSNFRVHNPYHHGVKAPVISLPHAFVFL